METTPTEPGSDCHQEVEVNATQMYPCLKEVEAKQLDTKPKHYQDRFGDSTIRRSYEVMEEEG